MNLHIISFHILVEEVLIVESLTMVFQKFNTSNRGVAGLVWRSIATNLGISPPSYSKRTNWRWKRDIGVAFNKKEFISMKLLGGQIYIDNF